MFSLQSQHLFCMMNAAWRFVTSVSSVLSSFAVNPAHIKDFLPCGSSRGRFSSLDHCRKWPSGSHHARLCCRRTRSCWRLSKETKQNMLHINLLYFVFVFPKMRLINRSLLIHLSSSRRLPTLKTPLASLACRKLKSVQKHSKHSCTLCTLWFGHFKPISKANI